MSESLAFMSASSSSQSRLISLASCGSMALPSVPGNSPNRSSCRRVRARKFSAPANVMSWVGSAHVSTVVVVINPLHRVCANHTGNRGRSQSEVIAPAVVHDAHSLSPTRRGNSIAQAARRSRKWCALRAPSTIPITPGMDRYRFVTATFSSAGNNPPASDVNCAMASELIAVLMRSECTVSGRERSQNGCALCAQSALLLVCKSGRYRFVTVACSRAAKECAAMADLIALCPFRKCAPLAHERSQIGCALCARLRIETTSLVGDVDCAAASQMIAFRKCAEGSQKGYVWRARTATQLATKFRRDSFMTWGFSYPIILSRKGDIADAFSVHHNRADCLIREPGKCCLFVAQNGRPADAARLPKLRLGEMYAATNCLWTLQKLLPVVCQIGYAHH